LDADRRLIDKNKYNTYRQHHFYVDPAVSEFEDDFIFGVTGKLSSSEILFAEDNLKGDEMCKI
jgi:hypothetical protein